MAEPPATGAPKPGPGHRPFTAAAPVQIRQETPEAILCSTLQYKGPD